jgi:hypothetical protein
MAPIYIKQITVNMILSGKISLKHAYNHGLIDDADYDYVARLLEIYYTKL